MSPVGKLALAAAVVAGGTSYLAYLGSSTSWQYYLLFDECVAAQNEFAGRRLRVSGQIAPNSLHIRDDRGQATFLLHGQRSQVPVSCEGPLPDNLVEGIDVVVEGVLNSAGLLCGDKVLTRCASKYQASTTSD
jgi:cytochrome c-type biogenesis protein CcmE